MMKLKISSLSPIQPPGQPRTVARFGLAQIAVHLAGIERVRAFPWRTFTRRGRGHFVAHLRSRVQPCALGDHSDLNHCRVVPALIERPAHVDNFAVHRHLSNACFFSRAGNGRKCLSALNNPLNVRKVIILSTSYDGRYVK